MSIIKYPNFKITEISFLEYKLPLEYKFSKHCLQLYCDSDTGLLIAICNIARQGIPRWEVWLSDGRYLRKHIREFTICVLFRSKYDKKSDRSKDWNVEMHLCVPIHEEDLARYVRPTKTLIRYNLRDMLRLIVRIIEGMFRKILELLEDTGYEFILIGEVDVGYSFHSQPRESNIEAKRLNGSIMRYLVQSFEKMIGRSEEEEEI